MSFDPNPRKVDPSATEVVMNGKTYRKASSIAISRWPYLQRYQAAWIHGKQAHEIHKVMGELEKFLNKTDFVGAAVMVHNVKNDIAGMTDAKRLPAAAALTMLFWNYEGEDVGTCSDDLMSQKLNDALNSGIDSEFFFVQALSATPGFISASSPTPQPEGGSSTGAKSKKKNPAT